MTRVAAGAGTAAKTARQRAILELVRTRTIRSQGDLVAALRRRRLDVTQATVSRDIRELGLVRVSDPDGPRYVAAFTTVEPDAPPSSRLRATLREHVRGIETVEVLVVVRCRPSTAPLVAAAIDASRLGEVAGTVAGDDTVLVVCRSRSAATRLERRLHGVEETPARARNGRGGGNGR